MGAPLKWQTGEDERKFQPRMKHGWTQILGRDIPPGCPLVGEATDEPKFWTVAHSAPLSHRHRCIEPIYSAGVSSEALETAREARTLPRF